MKHLNGSLECILGNFSLLEYSQFWMGYNARIFFVKDPLTLMDFFNNVLNTERNLLKICWTLIGNSLESFFWKVVGKWLEACLKLMKH